MSVVWIARHAETTWNLAGRYQGRLESALSALGMRQAFALADRFARDEPAPARIVASPLLRCRATAAPTAARLDVPLETDARLIEIAHGTWEGRYRDDIAAHDPARYRTWRDDPAHVAFDGGETLADVLTRWRAFARDLRSERRDTLVVTHDAVVRCALLDLRQRPLAEFWEMRVENAAFARARNADGTFTLEVACDDGHLGALHADPADQAL